MSWRSDEGHRPLAGLRSRPWRPWHLLVPLIFALAGLLFVTSGFTARRTSLQHDRLVQLSDLIKAEDQHNRNELAQVNSAKNDVDALTRGQTSDSRVQAAQQQVDQLSQPSGFTSVSGASVSVSLNDAPPNAVPKPGVPAPAPDWLVVHQQDVQAVVNALWQGGATALEIMDQRIISTSAVRCVGNTLILDGRVYSPPYVITAVGDQPSLLRSLATNPAIQIYQEYVDAYGLGYKVSQSANTTMPAYSGAPDLRYAAPVR